MKKYRYYLQESVKCQLKGIKPKKISKQEAKKVEIDPKTSIKRKSYEGFVVLLREKTAENMCRIIREIDKYEFDPKVQTLLNNLSNRIKTLEKRRK